jgi:hypothetical protein
MMKEMNKDIELTKIQAAIDLCNSDFVAKCAFIAAVGGSIVVGDTFATLTDKLSKGLSLIGFILATAFALTTFIIAERFYIRNIRFVDSLLKQFEDNKPLPSLEEIVKKIRY